MQPLTVTQFVELVNTALASLELVTVEGEVEEYKVIQGKWAVFDLKDKESLVRCFMPVWKLRTQIEDGMLVRATGQPKLRPKGFFSFVLEKVEPAGEGALKRAFELLRKKLTEEGLFAVERKRPLPRFPHHIALITSRDAAAYGDFLKVLKARLGGLRISFIHTAVQGEEAPEQILKALERANTELKDLDVIVMVRGGGSLEDLQAFNDELIVRAVASSRAPTVVGIGHERDVTLAELAADVRASTPSNAAELVVRTRQEIAADITHLTDALQQKLNESMYLSQQRIRHHVHVLRGKIESTRQNVSANIQRLQQTQRRWWQAITWHQQNVVAFYEQLRQHMHKKVILIEQRQQHLTRLLKSFSPEATLRRGYSITRTTQGALLKNKAQAKAGEQLVTQLSQGEIYSTVAKKPHPAKRGQTQLGLDI